MMRLFSSQRLITLSPLFMRSPTLCPVPEEGAANDEVILFTDVNYSFSIVYEVTYSMPSHDSFSLLVVVSYPCTKVSKQDQDVMSWNVANCHLQ